MIAIIDYGVGNLFSLCSAFKKIGAETVVTNDAETIKKADKLVLPGVGAFGDAVEKLRNSGLDKIIIEQVNNGKFLLGICLGMQLLFEKSYEYGVHNGLGLIDGEVVPIENNIPRNLKIPHIGWNSLKITQETPLFKYINDSDCVYFVHSFYAKTTDKALIANTNYGIEITAAVQRNNIFGCQFHPEKSSTVGLNIIRAFCEM